MAGRFSEDWGCGRFAWSRDGTISFEPLALTLEHCRHCLAQRALKNGRPDNNNEFEDMAPLAWLVIEKLALENVAQRGVEKAVEPTDRIELLHVDRAIRHAGWIDMYINYFADDQRMPVGAKFKHALELALEMNRNLLDTRRRDFDARERGKTGLTELGIAGRQGIG